MLRNLRSLSLVLACAALCAPAAANAAPATKKVSAAKSKKASTKKSSKKTTKKKSTKKKKVVYPTVSKVSPLKLGIGDKLVLKGKSYKSGKGKNYVVFKRDGGRALFVKADKATSTAITVTVPAKLLTFFTQKSGAPQPTRFRLRVLASRLAKTYTKNSRSPLISPTPSVAPADSTDCDGDGVVNTKDADDDNDLISDVEEAGAGTNPCSRDSDGDGNSDGWEIQSAKDRNGGVYPKSVPVPNPLDKSDADVDNDGDGLTNMEEYSAWATFGGNSLALNYSGGNTASAGRVPVTGATKQYDRDSNGFLSDFERDADGDGIANMDEMRTGHNTARIVKPGSQDPSSAEFYDYGVFTEIYLQHAAEASATVRCAGINQVPWYCVDKTEPDHIKVQKVDTLFWLSSDTDGDGIRDDADDVDHDGLGNYDELTTMRTSVYGDRKFAPLDACVPNIDNRACLLSTVDIDQDGADNGVDLDDDGDGLPDTDEVNLYHTSPLLVDTDGDSVTDTFEAFSAKDLNSTNLPYPKYRPYPNALDADDANKDFDQDGLTLREEYQAWAYSSCGVAKNVTPANCHFVFPMSYSDGLQRTLLAGVKDGERDVDNDGLTNWVEAHGPLSGPDWWDAFLAQDANKCAPGYKESSYQGPLYLGTDFVNPDTDGDLLPDGADDIDHDGYTNLQESTRAGLFSTKSWCGTYVSLAQAGGDIHARYQPFNPCKPTYSDACHVHPPTGYYPADEDWESPSHTNGP